MDVPLSIGSKVKVIADANTCTVLSIPEEFQGKKGVVIGKYTKTKDWFPEGNRGYYEIKLYPQAGLETFRPADRNFYVYEKDIPLVLEVV